MAKLNDIKKLPGLRDDLVISKMVNKLNITYVIKDPLQTKYFRFRDDEWDVIELFTGKHTLEELILIYNEKFDCESMDLETITDYRDNLESMDLLTKSKKEMNVLLVEKMKESREFQLLAKKGSLMYKRFPIIDPDKFFDRIIGKVSFLWTRGFLVFSGLIMLAAVILIFMHWNEFNTGVQALFSFSEMSWTNVIVLWVIIYVTIAIHEVGHGLTCKYYGGEVHEIGFLLLFFQPCLYCNVNDAWLFDKKWKQIMVTIAGGYIEFFIGSICTFIWVLTSPNTFINTIAFQTMTICSVSTVMFNFNPLIKLDGYYLFSDFVEIPNLKDDSTKYLKYIVQRYIFGMNEQPPFDATLKEKRIYFGYGFASAIWMTLLLTGLVGMAMGMLVDKFHFGGVLITGWIAYKMLGSYVTSSGKFFFKWAYIHKEKLSTPKAKFTQGVAVVSLLTILFVPFHFRIKGDCTLEALTWRIIPAPLDGKITQMKKLDGALIKKGDQIAILENISAKYNRDIAFYDYQKSEIKLRQALVNSPLKVTQFQRELKTKELKLRKKDQELNSLNVIFSENLGSETVLSCDRSLTSEGTFVKKGDEICRALEISQVKTLIEVSEQQVRFMAKNQRVDFKLVSSPITTYSGIIKQIRPSGKTDPKNPKHKIYTAEILINNTGSLRPGMNGIAKIYAEKMPLIKYAAVKFTSAIRLDLFF